MGTKKQDFIILTVLIFAGAIIGYIQGQEASWDFANYHYYSVWALFHGRIGYDIMPSGISSYINPLLDIPLYLYIKFFNNHPHFIAFLQSIWWGVCAFLTYKIAGLFFVGKNKVLHTAISTIIGITGVLSVACSGLSSNDLPICAICLLGFYLIFKKLWSENIKSRTKIMLLSGLLIGGATGLKYLGLYIFLSLFVSIIILCLFKQIEQPKKVLIPLFLGFLAGFAITGLWWCILLWQKFGNPFFPKLNQIFQSPLALPESYADTRHLPENIRQYLFYPFYWVANPDRRMSFESLNLDFRPVFTYISCIILSFISIKSDLLSKIKDTINSRAIMLLNIFIVIYYLFWLNTESYLRYLLFVEFLTGILICSTILFLLQKEKNRIRNAAIVVITIFLICSTQFCELEECRLPFKDKFVKVENLNLPNNSVVLELGGWPSAIFIPFQNPKTQWIYIYGDVFGFNFKYPESEEAKIQEIIKNNQVYLIYSTHSVASVPWDYVQKFVNIENFDCRELSKDENYFKDDFYFCSPK